jgi:hypothetical protein
MPGCFWFNTSEEWIRISEAVFPEYLGSWMRVYGLAGPGESTPSKAWPISSET